MKKNFKVFEEMGANKEDLKFKNKRSYDLEKKINKLIDKATNIFQKVYHDLFYLDNINFQLYGVDVDISKYAKVELEEINDERVIHFYKELLFLFDWLSNAKARCKYFKEKYDEVYKENQDIIDLNEISTLDDSSIRESMMKSDRG